MLCDNPQLNETNVQRTVQLIGDAVRDWERTPNIGLGGLHRPSLGKISFLTSQ